ncbi:MAG: cation-transporting P-type ATPase [Chitinophagaceae bacterium]
MQFDTSYWLKQLSTSENGLSQKNDDEVLKQSGNKKKADSHFVKDIKLLLSQFKSPLMLLLIGAVVLSAFLGDTSDVFIILFIVLSTGLLSFFQERNAGRVVEKLQSMISLKSTVLRDNKAEEKNLNLIVKGDILLLKAGEMIPADCLIVESNELHANKSSLTGESYPVRKESDNVDQGQLDKPGKWDLKFIRNYMVIFGTHSSVFDVITFLTLFYLL